MTLLVPAEVATRLPSCPSLSATLAGGNMRQPHCGAALVRIAPRHLLSRPVVIVPDCFPAQEGLTSDDVQYGRMVTRNEVLRRHVAGRGREGSR
jgi:hypothetical protein